MGTSSVIEFTISCEYCPIFVVLQLQFYNGQSQPYNKFNLLSNVLTNILHKALPRALGPAPGPWAAAAQGPGKIKHASDRNETTTLKCIYNFNTPTQRKWWLNVSCKLCASVYQMSMKCVVCFAYVPHTQSWINTCKLNGSWGPHEQIT